MAGNGEQVTYFAETDARGRRARFGIKAADRTKHMYVIGKTGMGKSTLLENMAIQDIWNGNGVAYIDPHGSSAEKLLGYVPEERIGDVLYFAPFDMEYPVGFNIMEDVDPDKRHFVVNGLMSTFEKIWADAWSARMSYILQNTIHALLEYPGATLLDVNRMYTNKTFRDKVVANITDMSVKAFWTEEFTKYTDRYTQEATPAIQNKVGQLAANPLIRNIVGQPHSSFDVRQMMDNRKILIVNLSKGRVGEGNATLLGSMMVNKIYLSAMSRADATNQQLQQLPNFYLYVDEFQNFANKSFADILSESRKYKLNLTITHQYIEQMEEEVQAAVFGNVGTLISFRVGAFDAEVLEKEFAPTFTAQDIVNLGFKQIYLKLMIDGVASQPFSAETLPPIDSPTQRYDERVTEYSQKTYARPRQEVEGEITHHFAVGGQGEPSAAAGQKTGKTEKPKKAGALSKVSSGEGYSLSGGERSREKREAKPAHGTRKSQEGERKSESSRQRVSHGDAKRPRTAGKPPQREGGQSGEGRAALRDALAGVLAAQQSNTAKESAPTERAPATPAPAEDVAEEPTGVEDAGDVGADKAQREKQQTTDARNADSASPKREVPEEVLRKLLDVEEDT